MCHHIYIRKGIEIPLFLLLWRVVKLQDKWTFWNLLFSAFFLPYPMICRMSTYCWKRLCPSLVKCWNLWKIKLPKRYYKKKKFWFSVGRFKTQVVNACREAIKNNNVNSLFKIIKTGSSWTQIVEVCSKVSLWLNAHSTVNLNLFTRFLISLPKPVFCG